MGTAEIACPMLRAVMGMPGVEVVAAVTQPDRPRGRHLDVAACSVKVAALALGLPVLTPEKINTSESLAALRVLQPDVIVVVAYGQILREALLQLPARGSINVHASLLPRYRGAAPIQWSIARGETVTGVTTMLMNAQMDAGDMLMQAEVAIGPEDTAGTLQPRLAEAGAALLTQTLTGWVAGNLVPRPQDVGQVLFAPKLRKQDGEIDWTLGATEIHNRIRGFNPWPGCFCQVPGEGERVLLKVHRAVVADGAGEPGRVLDVGGNGPLVACGQGALRLLEVQPPGRKAMGGDAFLHGRGLKMGERLG